MSAAEHRTGTAGTIALFFVALAGFVLRVLPVSRYLIPGEPVFLFDNQDALYHVRRAALYAARFPDVSTFDRFLAFPSGDAAPWPPLYDYVIGLMSLMTQAPRPDIRTISLIVAVLPPLLSSLSAVVLYLLVRRMTGKTMVALTAAAFYAVMPGNIMYSYIGAGDHHGAEVFLFIWVLYRYSRDISDAGVEKKGRRAYATGLLTAAGVCIWQGFIVYTAVISCITALLSEFCCRDRKAAGEINTYNLQVLVTAGLATAAVRAIFPAEVVKSLFSFDYFSYFQPVFFLVLSVALAAVISIAKGGGNRKITTLAAVLALIAVTMLFFRSFVDGVLGGIGFLASSDRWIVSIGEFQSIFTMITRIPPRHPSEWYGLLLALSVLGPLVHAGVTGLSIRRQEQNGICSRAVVLVMTVGVAISLLALNQYRWTNAAAPFMAYAAAVLFFRILSIGHRMLRLSVGGCVLAVFLFPGFHTAWNTVGPGYLPGISSDLRESLAWMRDRTPSPQKPFAAEANPPYAVFSFWDLGHQIQTIAGRPVMASNFGFNTNGNNFADSLRAWHATDTTDVENILDRYGIRYLLLPDPLIYFLASPRVYFGEHDGKSLLTNALFGRPLVGLFEFDGGRSSFGPALGRFRLIHESPQPSAVPYHFQPVSRYKVFEFVKGAVLSGRTVPGREVRATADLTATGGRPFRWHTQTTADRNGIFTLTVPYATSGGNYDIAATAPYAVTDGRGTAAVEVSDADVVMGKTLVVKIPR